MEIVLVNDWTPEQAFRSGHKFKRFADRRFADVVAADQEGVAVEIDDALCDASEIGNCQTSYTH